VTELNLAEAQRQPESCPPPAPGEAAFVGAASCAKCHKDAADFWVETKHARAYDTLAQVNKQFSLDCIQCHVTGWQQPGGVCRIDRTEVGGPAVGGRGVGRRDVQCEDCHGPGSEHVKNPKDEKWYPLINPWRPKENETAREKEQRMLRVDKFCQGCHDIDNDVKYKFEQRWPPVAHPTP
jgi:hypothetical protein